MGKIMMMVTIITIIIRTSFISIPDQGNVKSGENVRFCYYIPMIYHHPISLSQTSFPTLDSFILCDEWFVFEPVETCLPAQILPHTNFNDLFFDLFYVAAAYNLGSLIRASPTSMGLLYFLGCFYPIMMIWFTKTFYDSRFDAGNDLYHKVYEVLVTVVLATAVLYIRPVAYLSTPAQNEDIFVFATCISISSLLAIGRSVDIILNVDGEPAAKTVGKFDIKMFASMLVFYLLAAVVSAISHFGTDRDVARRFLAGGDYGDTNHVPIILLLIGANMYTVGIVVMAFREWFIKDFDHKA